MIQRPLNEQPLFKAKNLSLKFEVGEESVTAVKESSFSIPEHAITIIYGPSGSGKSSLLNILSGLQRPTSGSLTYRGKDVYSQTQNDLAHFRATELGIVYQTNYWVKSLSVLENVSLPQYFLGKTRAEAHHMTSLALERVNMSHYMNKFPVLLSGGEQQRIAMARAIVNDSPVLIADEPTGNLDSRNGDMIINLLGELQRDSDKTIILVTHNMEYLPFAHHLISVQDGEITEISARDIPKTVQGMLDTAQKRITVLMKDGGSHE